ncbi:MAG: sodium-dependent transporter [Eubacteriales bacterium]|nr:sodium-dependent transporter [Eubacteriales bacterium]
METKKTSSFTGSLGFVLAAAGSAVGVGNIWRFPYLAAKDGGGLFLIVYLALVVTFGFTLLVTDVAIGRKTRENALHAFGSIRKRWAFLGYLTFLVPAIIMTYYSVIGGWIVRYLVAYVSGKGTEAARDGYFTAFITSKASPVFFMLVFLAFTAFVVYRGVEKGIEKFARIVMPGLLLMVVGIGIFSLTLKAPGENGQLRTGLDGFLVYVIPSLEGITVSRFLNVLLDAMSQLFFSLSVSMGIMITYGSYVKKDINLNRSLSQIEIFDTLVAFLAGMMIIPAVYVFFGTEGMASGPSLMFVSLPRVFEAMGAAGQVLGAVFFLMVVFAALTSSVSIMETLVANCMDIFHASRQRVSMAIGLISAAASLIICLGYNVFYFEMKLPNGSTAQLLDLMDYISNSFLMPFISLLTCIFVGWIVKPDWICQEMEASGHSFTRKRLYTIMIRYVTPIMMAVLFLQSAGVFELIKR